MSARFPSAKVASSDVEATSPASFRQLAFELNVIAWACISVLAMIPVWRGLTGDGTRLALDEAFLRTALTHCFVLGLEVFGLKTSSNRFLSAARYGLCMGLLLAFSFLFVGTVAVTFKQDVGLLFRALQGFVLLQIVWLIAPMTRQLKSVVSAPSRLGPVLLALAMTVATASPALMTAASVLLVFR